MMRRQPAISVFVPQGGREHGRVAALARRKGASRAKSTHWFPAFAGTSERYPALRRAAGFALSRGASLAALPWPFPAMGKSISRWPAAVFLPFLLFAAFGSAALAFAAGARLPDP